MKKLVEYIIKGLVDNPKAVKIHHEETDDGYVTIDVKVAEEDIGKVIGKRGNIINSIRKLTRVNAIINHKRFRLNLLEEPQKD